MNRILAFLPLIASVPAAAQDEQPYKMIVLRDQAGLAITDYASKDRCEVAKNEIEKKIKERNEANRAKGYPRASALIPIDLKLEVHCMPG